MMIPDLCAVILAGGESRRMGVNKALLILRGRPLVRTVLEAAEQLTDQVYISTNDPSSYRFLGLHAVRDVFPGQGPLAGLHAVMLQSPRSLFLLLACDMPNLNPTWLRRLVELSAGFDAVIPCSSDGGRHPLCAVYRRSCLPQIETNLHKGIFKVTDVFATGGLRVRWLDGEEGGFSDRDLANINTPADLERYRNQT